MTAGEWIDLTSRGGVLGLLLLILWTGQRGVWVWGKTYDKCVADLDRRTDYMAEVVIPLLTKAQDALKEAAATTREIHDEQRWQRQSGPPRQP